MRNYIMEAVQRADNIRAEAEADYERDTARLIRLLDGSTIWDRALALVLEERQS